MIEPSRYGWQGTYMVSVEADDQTWLTVGQGDKAQAEEKGAEVGRLPGLPDAGKAG